MELLKFTSISKRDRLEILEKVWLIEKKKKFFTAPMMPCGALIGFTKIYL
jgi:hypothetical protein